MMYQITLEGRGDFAEWRDAARVLASADVAPEHIDWRLHEPENASLAFGHDHMPQAGDKALTVPPAFMALAQTIICHSDPARFSLLYRLLWRLRDERRLLEIISDADVARARLMEKNIRRDAHKMTAFVRFKEIAPEQEGARRQFIAWFEPEHYIVARTASFFQRRFNDMDWVILTPKGSSAWNGKELKVSDKPCDNPEISDDADELWRTYYANIFNPARLKIKAMQAEMPKKYWKNLPEATLIPDMIAQAETRVLAMAEREATQPRLFHERLQDAARRIPAVPNVALGTLEALREEASRCTRCELHCKATQTVFGEGPDHAQVMFVGEQPGDQEDLAGRPFIGPAGQLFNQALGEVGLDRRAFYITNAVKHFKYEPRGKRRIHQKPDSGEVSQCRWWLEREIALLKPKLVVAMGATALLSLTNSRQRLGDLRGQVVKLSDEQLLFVTVHPSYLLRIPDSSRKAEEYRRFCADLTEVKTLIARFGADQFGHFD